MKKKFALLLAILGIVITLQGQIPSDGLVAHYTFDNTLNDAASGNNLSSSGATYGVGEIENAFSFTGSEECYSTDVNFRRVFDSKNSWSVSMWYNSSVPYNEATGYGTNAKMLFACDGVNSSPYKRTWIRASESGIHLSRMLGSGNGVELVAEYNFLPNTWYHVSVNYDGLNTTVYINGAIADHNVSGDIVQDIGSVDANTERVTIGGNRQDNVIQWKGLIDETYIYNRTLTSEEVEGVFEESGRSVSDESLVAYYPFNANADDESGKGNHGTVNSATLTTDRFGNENSAYYFDGIDDFIEVNNHPTLNNQTFTISAWVNCASIANETGEIILKGDYPSYNYGINKDINNYFTGFSNSNNTYLGVISTSPVQMDNWYHMIFTHDGSSAKLYIDNTLMSDSVASDVSINTDNLYFGSYFGTSLFFNGIIDDIRIYSTSLDSSEVTTLYNEGKCFETVYDTITTEVFDTTYVTINDTLITEVMDTTYITINDTIQIYEYISVTDTLVIDAVLTGLNPPENINRLKVYPNPAKDFIFINTGDYTKMDRYQMKIIDQLGSVVFETNVEEPLYEINLSTWSGTGLYFINIIDDIGQTIEVRKIVLQ